MSKDENEDLEVDIFDLDDGVEAQIEASESGFVRLTLMGQSLTNMLAFEPDEADRIAQAMLKAVEHIKSKQT